MTFLYIRRRSSIFVSCQFYVRNIRFISGDIRFVRLYPLKSFVHAQNLKRTVTNKDIRWLSCACPFCPVYTLPLSAAPSLTFCRCTGDIRCPVRIWNLNANGPHKPNRKRTPNGQTQDSYRINSGHDEYTNELKTDKPYRTDEYRISTEYIQNVCRIPTGG